MKADIQIFGEFPLRSCGGKVKTRKRRWPDRENLCARSVDVIDNGLLCLYRVVLIAADRFAEVVSHIRYAVK